MTKFTLPIVAAVLAATLLSPATASACRVGYSTFLFEDVPPPPALGEVVYKMHFSSAPTEIARLKDVPAVLNGVGLMGVAYEVADETRTLFPVYALATDCDPNFGYQPRKVLDGEFFLFGKFVEDDGRKAFFAKDLLILSRVAE